MNWRTKVDLPNYPFTIQHTEKVFFIGSCFSTSIANRFYQTGYSTVTNPFGTVYNSSSIVKQLNIIIGQSPIEQSIYEYDGLYYFLDGNTSFRSDNKAELYRSIQQKTELAKEQLLKAKAVFVTIGSSTIFRNEHKDIVANCHKLPANLFKESELSLQEIEQDLHRIISLLHDINQQIEIIFTISPVRYLKVGLVRNSLIKATLRVAIEQVLKNEKVHYFPAYEMVIDELRDYRFYNKNLTHVNEQAIDFIWQQTTEAFLDSKEASKRNDVERFFKFKLHRVSHENEDEHHAKLLEKRKELFNKYPHLTHEL